MRSGLILEALQPMADGMCPPTSTKNNPAFRPRRARHTPPSKIYTNYTTVGVRRTIGRRT